MTRVEKNYHCIEMVMLPFLVFEIHLSLLYSERIVHIHDTSGSETSNYPTPGTEISRVVS